MTLEIDNIVLSGGGIRAIPILGTLSYLNKKGYLEKVKSYAGTSMGAIIAALCIIGYTIDELIDILLDTNIGEYIEVDIIHVLQNKSLLDATKFRNYIYDIIKTKINPNITLKELYDETQVELNITVSCLTTCSVHYMNYKNEPNLQLVKSLYMTSAIPLIFSPIEYNNKLYIDGGIIDNFPIHLYDCKKTLGINTPISNLNPKDNIFDYIYTVCLITQLNLEKNKCKDNKNIICIYSNTDMLGINVNKDDILTMYHMGYIKCKEFIKSYISEEDET